MEKLRLVATAGSFFFRAELDSFGSRENVVIWGSSYGINGDAAIKFFEFIKCTEQDYPISL